MDYTKLICELDNASLFDLYRLRAAINKELDNPERIEKVKRQIAVGDMISYFVSEENRLVEAVVLEIKRTRVLVKNINDGRRWDIPFYMINIENSQVNISRNDKSRGIDRQEIRVGDYVGFQDKFSNRSLRGKVIRLNPKTVTLIVEPNQQWRVAYSLLHPIFDGEKTYQKQNIIEGFLVKDDSQ